MVTEAEARRVRPFMSGIVALVVSLVVAIGWYFLGRPDETAQPVRTVDWSAWVKAGKADNAIAFYAPAALPHGWRATSVGYTGGNLPVWELGMLTRAGRFAGIKESRDSVKTLVAKDIDTDAVRGKDVTINGSTWQTWSDSGGDFGLARTLTDQVGLTETVLVYGSAPDADLRAFAATLVPQNPHPNQPVGTATPSS
jgi:hypothetical protein